MRAILTATVVSCVSLLSLALGVTPSLAASPWWHLTSGARPTVLPEKPGSKANLVVTAANLGDAPVDGAADTVVVEDTPPQHLKLLNVEAIAGGPGPLAAGAVTCNKETPLKCSFASTLPSYDQIEVRIKVETLKGALSGEENQVGVAGGGAAAAQISSPVQFGSGPTPFGVESYELTSEEADGAPTTQAGSHPFQQTTTIHLNQGPASGGFGGAGYEVFPAALVKDLDFHWPAGLVGNPSPLSHCTLSQFLTNVQSGGTAGEVVNACPPQTAVGVATVTVEEPELVQLATFSVPLFNLEPSFGEPARLGFYIGSTNTPVLIDPALRSGNGEDYGIDVKVENITQISGLLATSVTVWGVPGESSHDESRGWGCLFSSRGLTSQFPCQPPEEAHPPAFLIMPTSCAGAPLETSVQASSWVEPLSLSTPFAADPAMSTLDGCNRLKFSPSIHAEPSADRASAPSGLTFSINFKDEGLTSGTGIAQSQLKDTVVTLPEGFTINPSAGVGLGGCTAADYARETLESAPGAGCPDDSKLGTVEIETPLLTQKINGSLFIAQPYENPFSEPGHPNGSLVALYIVVKNPETGVLIKLAGKVTPDPVTGRLTTTFQNNPQLPFDRFNFHFREGQQAPLVTPALCGTYTTQAQLTPWAEPLTALAETSSFTITKGFDGGACPSGAAPPFHPGIVSGTLNNNAATFSPFYLHLTRTDGEQEMSGFSTNLPAGLTGDLTGIPFCPEADIEAARHKTGAQEEAAPSCPAASQIGHTLVGTGVGAVLAYVPGKIYLAGPFHGAPLSIVSITSATVGPFDLGTVVLRFGLDIDPVTARVNVTPTSSEPIPTIIDGIVTHVRDIRVYIDRSNFILDSSSCNPMTISSTLSSPAGASTTVTSPFQAANCANLAFKPTFKVSTSGKTSRTGGASLHVQLTYPSGALVKDTNIAKVKVDLPRQLPSRLTTLQKACTETQFEANPAGCPAESRVGQAKAVTPLIPVPLEGPAYFVSHGGAKFPELIIVLQGYGFTIDLHGETFINKEGITSSTFAAVPDQPIGSFELTLPEGKYSALAANGNLCAVTKTVLVKKKVTVKSKGHKKTVTRKVRQTTAGSLVMPTAFVAQNGAEIHQNTPITVTDCTKATTKNKKAKRAESKPHKGKQ